MVCCCHDVAFCRDIGIAFCRLRIGKRSGAGVSDLCPFCLNYFCLNYLLKLIA
jgi:hypothetical protein